MNNKIFIICGPSGVGKGTIIKGLIDSKTLPVDMVATITTRQPKPRDKATGHYVYISKNDFIKKINSGLFLEHNLYNSNYYGTLKKDLENIIAGSKIGLMEQNIDLALFTKKIYPKNVITIFIDSHPDIIHQRLIKRGENSREEIKKRLEIGKIELSQKQQCDFIVDNPENHPDQAIKKVEHIIRSVLKSA